MNTAQRILYHLPPPAECLAILVGCAELTLFGLGGLASPRQFATGYGLPLTDASATDLETGNSSETEKAGQAGQAPSQAQRRYDALIAAVAARNVQNGLCLLTFGLFWRDRRALGTVVASGLVTTLADTLFVYWYGSKDAVLGHVFGVGNSVLIGGALLFL